MAEIAIFFVFPTRHFRIRQTQANTIFTYILPPKIPLNPPKPPKRTPQFFFSKTQINIIADLATLVQDTFSFHHPGGNHKKLQYFLNSLSSPSKENNKRAISAIFSPILTCFTPQKRVFRQKTHLRGPGGPISSQKIEIITNNRPEQICSIPF